MCLGEFKSRNANIKTAILPTTTASVCTLGISQDKEEIVFIPIFLLV